jgi:hypothetical protein
VGGAGADGAGFVGAKRSRGDLLRELGIEGERGHIAMGALERRDERLAKLEER